MTTIGTSHLKRPSVAPVEIDFLPTAGRSDTERMIAVHNPARIAEVVGLYPRVGPEHVDRAVAAAQGAQRQWAGLTASERMQRLRNAAPSIAAINGLAELLTREQGKTLPEATMESGIYATMLDAYAGHVDWLDSEEPVAEGPQGVFTLMRRPVGTVGLITPSNWPTLLSLVKLVPALLAGNAVILVTAPTTPLTINLVCARIAEQLPEGLLSVMTCDSPAVAARLVEHPLVGAISFTGSVQVGQIVARNAAPQVKKLVLELGGNDAALVLDDQELTSEFITQIALKSVVMTSGQICTAIKRVYVPAARVPAVAEALGSFLSAMRVGDGLDPSVTMGPVHSKAGMQKVRGLIAAARAQGAKVQEYGELVADPQEGHFVLPTVVTGLQDSCPLVQDEQFGPVLPIIGYDSVDQAIDMVNGTDFGLAASVFSADPERAKKLAARIQAGTIYVNAHFEHDFRAPYGGFKHSGLGREFGIAGVSEYTELQTIRMPVSTATGAVR